ncbi:diguanylate cyclase [Saccharopolyspora endophytica]|uniref:Diguanylate cyclase n=1 Tax=Saccharopolyspora endophytica TaxID=543886 RepID=A0ABS5DK82_9PSEU|nr:diguanylate cyclase [Saccharopolyspora endophytica]MBQ0926697.1 diguanylate cyclase [Saccharopolyspora endophytica]
MVIEGLKPCPLCQHRALDKLTGLADRWGWESKAPELLREARQAALLLIDLDRFKQINDVWGHQAGDHALVRTAQIVRHAVDEDALVGRYGSYGGDEFLVLLPTGSDHAVQVAETIRSGVRAMVTAVTSTSGESATLAGMTVSVGVAVRGPTDGWDLSSLISSADGALQQAKRAGRDRVCVANQAAAAPTRSLRVPAARSHSVAPEGREKQLVEVCRVMRGRWTPDVLMALWSGPHCYDELLDRLRNASTSDGVRGRDHRIPASTLVRTLRRLDRSGLIQCTGAGRAACYELSPLAHELAAAVGPLSSQQRVHPSERAERHLVQAG